MKKLILPLTIAAVLTFSCTTEKPAGTTILGEGTPYSNYPEIMVGKVKTVVEKNYWGIPEGDTFKKGNLLTMADRDSIGGWSDDFEAEYSMNGVLIACTFLYEPGKPTKKIENVIENNLIAQMNYFRNDSIKFYDKLKYDEKGFLTNGTRFMANVDTSMFSVDIKTNTLGYPTEIQLFNAKNEPTEKYQLTYDGQNRFLKYEALDKDGKIYYSHEVKYNDKSKVSELFIRDKDNKITGSNYFTYEYDVKGNWVKAIVKDDKNHVIIAERSYTYFE
jgi:hypothetical protein